MISGRRDAHVCLEFWHSREVGRRRFGRWSLLLLERLGEDRGVTPVGRGRREGVVVGHVALCLLVLVCAGLQ